MSKHQTQQAVLIEHFEMSMQREREHTEVVSNYEARVFDLEFQVTQLQRLVFGATRERFISDIHASQLKLGLDADERIVEEAVAATLEKISYERNKPRKKSRWSHEAALTLAGSRDGHRTR